jgi:uncharacterized lipoprotein
MAFGVLRGNRAVGDASGRGDLMKFASIMTTVRVGLCLVGLLALNACSVVTALFPDKQRQYQYTTEIPALEVPPDLSMSTMTGAKLNRGAGQAGSGGPGGDGAGASGGVQASPDDRKFSETKGATLAQNTEDVPLIELASPFPQAWNDVGRALGRMKVEVSDQNKSEGVYYVYYGGSEKAYEDRGMWGDISDLFSGGGPKSMEFRLKLEEHKSAKRTSTDVFLFDDEGKPVRSGVPLDLLKKLHRQLLAMYSGDDSDDPGASP